VATACALLIANSSWRQSYDAILHLDLGVFLGSWTFQQSALHWINDGLMAVFFLGVGLEIKHEVLTGRLRPASGGRFAGSRGDWWHGDPGLDLCRAQSSNPDALAGWAIPSATDIGFAVGILALIGSRVPSGLKVFLVALAIIDDLGAIVIIAIFYTDHLSFTALGLAGLLIASLVALSCNRSARAPAWPLSFVGAVCSMGHRVLQSGAHATLAGVALAFVIPASRESAGTAPSLALEHALKPWIAYFILPVFAFADAETVF